MIIDFGEKRSGIFIVSNGIVVFTSTIEVGGMTLTKIIQKSFKVSFEEAEKMKKKYGLQRNMTDQEFFSVLLNSISVLRDEIIKHFIYWHTNKDTEGKDRPPIRRVILCGGDSNLIGLSEYFSINIKSRVEIANTWINIMDIKEQIPDINLEDSLAFASALGLALGDFKND